MIKQESWMPKNSEVGILSVKDTHAVQMCWEDAFAGVFRVQYVDTSVCQAAGVDTDARP